MEDGNSIDVAAEGGPPASESVTTLTTDDVMASFRFGWHAVKRHPWTIAIAAIWVIVGFLVQLGGRGLAGALAASLDDPDFHATLAKGIRNIAKFLSSVVGAYLLIGVSDVTLRAQRGESIRFTDAFHAPARLPAMLGASYLFGLAIFAGMCLLCIPGMLVGGALQFYGLRVVHADAGATDALAGSWRMARGHFLPLLLHFTLAAGLLVAGIVVVGIGVFVAMPIVWFSQAWLYERLTPTELVGPSEREFFVDA